MEIKKLTNDEVRNQHYHLYDALKSAVPPQILVAQTQEKTDKFLINSIRLLTEKGERECPYCKHKFYS